MLRVGLTGGLCSGKSTIGREFSRWGAFVSSADEIARRLMQPGEPVYAAIVRHFGSAVTGSDGFLDRKALAALAFQQHQMDPLNRIVHPAVVAEEARWMENVFAHDAAAVAIVESALIFEAEKWGTAPPARDRFDKLILVQAPDEVKTARFLERSPSPAGMDEAQRAGLRAEALRDAQARLALQIPDRQKAPSCDYVIDNSGRLDNALEAVGPIYTELLREAEARRKTKI